MYTKKGKAHLEPTIRPTSLDIAWAAGFYEGEGSCSQVGRKQQGFHASICQKDAESIVRLRDFFGGSIKLYNVGKDRRFPIYKWSVCGNRGRIFLLAIYEYLTSRRKVQVEATSYNLFSEPLQRGESFEILEQRLEVYCESRRTNPNLLSQSERTARYQAKKREILEMKATA